MVEIVRSRDADALGHSRASLRGPDWQRVTYGVYVRQRQQPDLLLRCSAVAQVLPAGTPFSHWTAAYLLGLWLPNTPSWLPLMATLPPDFDRPERQGLYVARSRAGHVPTTDRDGIRVVTPEVCVAQLAEDLRLVDLVIALDSALSLHGAGADSILAAVRRRQRGLPMLRRALALVDGRSESAWETVLRLIHAAAGIEVEPQYKVRDASGLVVARADLRVSGTRRLSEYDGADHRDRSRHERDLARDKMLSRLGLERYGYIKSELVHHPEMVIRDAESALGLHHEPRRMAQWHAWVDESSLTPAGYRRLLGRLHRYDKPLRGRGERRT